VSARAPAEPPPAGAPRGPAALIPAGRASIALALGTLYIVWGSTYLAIRWVVVELPPFAAGSLRFVAAGLIFLMLGLLRAGGTARPRAVELRNAALLGVAFLGISNGLVGLAEKQISSGLTALILALTPLWVALLEALWPGGRRPPLAAIAGLVIGFGGTATLVLGAPSSGHAVAFSGLAMVLIASFSWATASIVARSAARPSVWMISAGVEMVSGGLAQAVVALIRGEYPLLVASGPAPRAWLSLVYLALVGSCLGYGAFSWLTRRARPSLVSTYAYVNPLVAVTLGALLADEPLSPRLAFSGALIVLAVFLVTTARHPSKA
jgi:drug/metabolite transporter (DMT)-like permease